jgi:Asp-tRNA(Asn)/Glu-tRNA(Gln) amidotransferase B subunit
VRRRADGESSRRVEVKNLNSTRSIARAVAYEAARHVDAMNEGGAVDAETRGFDAKAGSTFPLRDKEAKLDYRFMVRTCLPKVQKRMSLSQTHIHTRIHTRIHTHTHISVCIFCLCVSVCVCACMCVFVCVCVCACICVCV